MLDEDLEKITDFIILYNKYNDRELIKDYVRQHERYGTFDWAIDDKGCLVSICRWNMDNTGHVASVLDFIIVPEWRGKGIGRDFILRALERWPKIERLEFARGVRGDERIRILKIKEILKRNIF